MVRCWTCRDCGADLTVYYEGAPGELDERHEGQLIDDTAARGRLLVDTRCDAEACPRCGSSYGFDGRFDVKPLNFFSVSRFRCPCGQVAHVYLPALSGPWPSLLEAAEAAAKEAGAVLVDLREPWPHHCPSCKSVQWTT